MRAEIQNMNDKGSIINASSVAGIIGFAKNAAYTASKVGLATDVDQAPANDIGLSRSAAKEVGDRGIRVNCINP
jgi:NAD(P)-dependent dehydrogenase (short-subunit alcohol dehydrogenase family)